MAMSIIPTGFDYLDVSSDEFRPLYIGNDTLARISEHPSWMTGVFRDGGVEQVVNGRAEGCVVFNGLNRADYEHCKCYCGRVDNPSRGRVLVVFVEEAADGRNNEARVLGWEWRREDPAIPGHPENWKVDLGEIAWRRA